MEKSQLIKNDQTELLLELINILTLIFVPITFVGFQLTALSIVTSSHSELLNVFKMPHMYWSTSNPSSCAGLLRKNISN